MSYVNKEVLARMIEAKADTVINGKEVFLYIKKWLDFLPTADVVEVRHGRWIRVESSDMATGIANKCSECGKMRYGSWLAPYCAVCGAKMDGERSDGGK